MPFAETGAGLEQSIHFTNPESNKEENLIEDALISADLGKCIPPKEGTPAYLRLKKAAENYIYYVKHTADSNRKGYSPTERRKCHDELCVLLLGKHHAQLTSEQRDKISNFAAYLTGELDLVDSW